MENSQNIPWDEATSFPPCLSTQYAISCWFPSLLISLPFSLTPVPRIPFPHLSYSPRIICLGLCFMWNIDYLISVSQLIYKIRNMCVYFTRFVWVQSNNAWKACKKLVHSNHSMNSSYCCYWIKGNPQCIWRTQFVPRSEKNLTTI